MATLLYRTLQSTLEYDTVHCNSAHMDIMAVCRNVAFKIVAKQVQIETFTIDS